MDEFTRYGKRKEPARNLRRNQTDAEKKLWSRLRDRQLSGFRFRRQLPLGPFFADFCYMEKRLVVEVDGGQHAGQMDQDANRTDGISKLGFHVIRFWNNEVLTQTDAVCTRILEELRKHSDVPSPVGRGWPKAG